MEIWVILHWSEKMFTHKLRLQQLSDIQKSAGVPQKHAKLHSTHKLLKKK